MTSLCVTARSVKRVLAIVILSVSPSVCNVPVPNQTQVRTETPGFHRMLP